MNQTDIKRCLRLYRHEVEAFEKLAAHLRKLRRERSPSRALERVARAEADLHKLGDGIAILPELATALQEERRVNAILRRCLEKAGVRVSYKDLAPPRPRHTDEEEDGDEDIDDEDISPTD